VKTRRSTAQEVPLLDLKLAAGKAFRNGTEWKCPVCEGRAYLAGTPISESEPQFTDGEFVVSRTHLSTYFRCGVCELELRGPSAIAFAQAPARFTVREAFDLGDLFDPGEDLYMNM
jgi:hypothetical protein